MKLHDQIVNQREFPHAIDEPEKHEGYMYRLVKHVKLKLPTTQIVACDEVTNYYYAGTDQEVWSMEKDFPNLAPPFRRMFIETSPPDFVVSEVSGTRAFTDMWPTLDNWGIFLEAIDPNDDDRANFPDVKWMNICALWCQFHGTVYAPLMQMAFAVDSTGKFVPSDDNLSISVLPHVPDTDYHMALIERLLPLVHPLLLAISFMHCKNVTQDKIEGGLNRQARRHQPSKQPPLSYHVLRIDPMRQVLRTEGGESENGSKKALHICRGHFATYTEDKPLFGHTTGMVWRPDHVRGRDKSRHVNKTYDVKSLEEKL